MEKPFYAYYINYCLVGISVMLLTNFTACLMIIIKAPGKWGIQTNIFFISHKNILL